MEEDKDPLEKPWVPPRPTFGHMLNTALKSLEENTKFQGEVRDELKKISDRLESVENYIEEDKKSKAEAEKTKDKRIKMAMWAIGILGASGLLGLIDKIRELIIWIADKIS